MKLPLLQLLLLLVIPPPRRLSPPPPPLPPLPRPLLLLVLLVVTPMAMVAMLTVVLLVVAVIMFRVLRGATVVVWFGCERGEERRSVFTWSSTGDARGLHNFISTNRRHRDIRQFWLHVCSGKLQISQFSMGHGRDIRGRVGNREARMRRP